jgi:hypothetical protein
MQSAAFRPKQVFDTELSQRLNVLRLHESDYMQYGSSSLGQRL